MTKGEFNKLTEDLPDDSELYFSKSCVYLGDNLLSEEEEFKIKSLGHGYTPSNDKYNIFLFD